MNEQKRQPEVQYSKTKNPLAQLLTQVQTTKDKWIKNLQNNEAAADDIKTLAERLDSLIEDLKDYQNTIKLTYRSILKDIEAGNIEIDPNNKASTLRS